MILSSLLFFSSRFETPLEGISLRKIIQIGPTIVLPASALHLHLSKKFSEFKVCSIWAGVGGKTDTIPLCFLYEDHKTSTFCGFSLEGVRNITESLYSSHYVHDSICMASWDCFKQLNTRILFISVLLLFRLWLGRYFATSLKQK